MAVSGGIAPKYRPGSVITMKVSAAVTAGALLEVSGSGTVAIAAAGSKKIVGVALQTASAANDLIPVQITGCVFNLTAKGTITAGNLVGAASDSSAAVSAITVDVTGTQNQTTINAAIAEAQSIVGVALQDIADAASGPILVRS